MIESNYLEDNNYIIQQMRRIPALASFDEAQFKELLQLSHFKKYKSGELIFEEGSYTSFIYYLISGKAKIVKNGKILAVLARMGDIFGEIAPIAGTARSASVYAVGNTNCLESDISNFGKTVGDDKYTFRYIMYRGFAEVLAKRLKKTTEALLSAKNEIDKLRSLDKKRERS